MIVYLYMYMHMYMYMNMYAYMLLRSTTQYYVVIVLCVLVLGSTSTSTTTVAASTVGYGAGYGGGPYHGGWGGGGPGTCNAHPYMHMYFNNDFLEGEKNTIHPTYPLGCGSTSSFGHLWARQFGLGSRHRGGPFLRRCSSLFSTISPLPLPNNSQKHTAPNHTFLWKPPMKLTGLKDSSTPTVFFLVSWNLVNKNVRRVWRGPVEWRASLRGGFFTVGLFEVGVQKVSQKSRRGWFLSWWWVILEDKFGLGLIFLRLKIHISWVRIPSIDPTPN